MDILNSSAEIITVDTTREAINYMRKEKIKLIKCRRTFHLTEIEKELFDILICVVDTEIDLFRKFSYDPFEYRWRLSILQGLKEIINECTNIKKLETSNIRKFVEEIRGEIL